MAPLAAENLSGSPDVVVALGNPVPSVSERPSADIVAELVIGRSPRYTFCQLGNEFVGRIFGIADFVIDAELRSVTCHPIEGGRSDLIATVLPGTVVAFLLSVAGGLVLHASAVELGGKALAFAGASGQGKSTMAALFCAGGAALVADDVLPLEFAMNGTDSEEVLCVPSGQEIRLRDKAASLVDRFGDASSVRMTSDDRHAVSPNRTAAPRVPLFGVVLPRPNKDLVRVEAKHLKPGEASYWLGRYQRIEGWVHPDHLRQQFRDVGRLVTAIPVYEVSVPWGPPFAQGLREQILTECTSVGMVDIEDR
jgi:hypothetical protein